MTTHPNDTSEIRNGRGRPKKDDRASAKLEACLSVWRYPNGEEFIELRTRLGKGKDAPLVKERFWPATFGSFAKAQKAAEARLLDIKHARLHGREIVQQARLPRMTMRQLLGDIDAPEREHGEYFTKHAFAAYDRSTIHSYAWSLKTYVLPAFGRRYLREITSGDINDFKAYLSTPADQGGLGLSQGSVGKILTSLGSVFSYARSRGYIADHPMQQNRVKYPSGGRAKSIDPKHPRVLEKVCAQMTFRRATFVRTVAYEALRPQEALALVYGDFIDETGRIRDHMIVNKAIKPNTPRGESPIGPLKTHRHEGDRYKQRHPKLWLPIGRDIYTLWEEDNFPPLDTLVWPSERSDCRGEPWRTPTVWGQSHWKTACKRANVRYDNIYDLRHLGATLLMVGPRWDFRRIAEFMGNSARVCEERYLHLAQWADEFKGKEMEEIIESVRSEPAANFERKLHLIDGSQSRPASEILRELST